MVPFLMTEIHRLNPGPHEFLSPAMLDDPGAYLENIGKYHFFRQLTVRKVWEVQVDGLFSRISAENSRWWYKFK